MHQKVTEHLPQFERALEHVKNELAALRGNRAHASLVEDIPVEVYGSQMSLKELASITIPEPRTIQIQPWDKTALKDIERALIKADLGVGVQVGSDVVRVTLPALTNESRQKLIKILGQKLEEGRVRIRQEREKVRDLISKAEKAKEMSEDERYNAQQELEDVTKDYLEKIKVLGDKKEEEVLTV